MICRLLPCCRYSWDLLRVRESCLSTNDILFILTTLINLLLGVFLSLFIQGNIFINFSAFFEIDFLSSLTKFLRSFIISGSLKSNRSRWFFIKFKDWLMTIQSFSFRKYLKQISIDWAFPFHPIDQKVHLKSGLRSILQKVDQFQQLPW